MKKLAIIIASLAAGLSIALLVNAQSVSTPNFWKNTGNNVQPLNTGWSLTVPQLGGGGTLCVHVDNNGLFSTSGADCGSGSGGSSSTFSGSGQNNYITIWKGAQVIGTTTFLISGTQLLWGGAFNSSGTITTNGVQVATGTTIGSISSTTFQLGLKLSISSTGTIGLATTSISQWINDSGYITVAPATTTIQVASTTLTGPIFVFGTSTKAGTFNISASGTTGFTWFVPPANDAYFAPSTTIPTVFVVNNLGNWAGTWQGVNSTSFYLATNPNNYISSSTGNGLYLQIANSLSDLSSTSSARTNIGYSGGNKITISATGTIGLTTSSISQFFNDSGYVTSSGGSGNVTFLANGFNFVTTSTIGFTAGTNITITTSTNGTYTINGSGSGSGGLASTTPFTVGNLTVVSSSGALATFGGSACTGGQFAQSVSASGTVLCGTAAGSGNGNVTVTAANVATSSFPYWLKGASSTLSVSSTLFIIPSTGDISVGTSTDGGRPFYVYGTTANGVMVVERNTQDNVAAQWDTYRIQADASGSAQNGFGPALEFDMKDSSGTNNVATIVAQRANNRSDTADLQFFGFNAGSQTNALDLHYTGHLSVNGTTDCGVGCILGIPTESASSSFLTLGNNLISGGNASGTFLGANPSSPFNGDFVNFQIASTSKFKVDGSGNVSSAGGLTAGGNITATGTLSTTGAATIGGNVTVTGGTVFANTLDTTNSQTLTLKAGPGASMMTLGQGTGIVNVTAGNQLQENGTRVVVQTRNVNTTSPLTGGGALSGDLTLACATCNVSTSTATFGLTMATSTGGTIATQTTSTTPFRIPFAGTLLGWTATANTSCTGSVDIWKLANAVPTKTNTITGGSFVSLSSSNFATGTVSGWTTAFSQGDLFMMNTTSTNSGCQAITVELDYKKS